MIGSTLTVHIIDVRNLGKVNGRSAPKVRIKVLSIDGEYKQKNQSSWTGEPRQQTADPVFNEVINFDIRTGNEHVRLEVHEVSQGLGKSVMIAELDLPLERLSEND